MFFNKKNFFAQLFYAPKKAEKPTFSHKNHKTTCFVTFLSGNKKNKQPFFLDSFKMPKKKVLYFTCFLCFFLCVKTFHKKSMKTSPIPSHTILLTYYKQIFHCQVRNCDLHSSQCDKLRQIS